MSSYLVLINLKAIWALLTVEIFSRGGCESFATAEKYFLSVTTGYYLSALRLFRFTLVFLRFWIDYIIFNRDFFWGGESNFFSMYKNWALEYTFSS